MPAADLGEAIALQNAVAFGLTGGIHSLDPDEIDEWLDSVEVGNAYVNRHTTGAIVRRQPFGGWKRSSVGPGAKAGGHDYLLQLGRWTDADPVVDATWLARAAASDRYWWDEHYGREHDPSGLFCESNVLRYRPRPGLVVRASADADPLHVGRTIAAARRAGAGFVVSQAPGTELVDAAAQIEDDGSFTARVAGGGWGRIRIVGAMPAGLHEAARAAGSDVIDAAVVASGRLELRWYLRDQAVSHTLHRFGNVLHHARFAPCE
jgi:RHH-type proline utilization regulon transcriptional repressor/proline dehydrogenase/delta 1-pyrroline-5-carboxylate dehydrogenase